MEYFLNAIHYCIWLIFMRFCDSGEKIVAAMSGPIYKYLFTKVYKQKYYEHLFKGEKTEKSFLHNKEEGLYIGWAHHWFGYFYSGYPSFISFVLLGTADKEMGSLSIVFVTLLFAIPIGLCYIPAYMAVFTNDRYLKYFKQFEKEDEQWHKKWKWITIAFCIGSIAFTFLGIGAMWCISLL